MNRSELTISERLRNVTDVQRTESGFLVLGLLPLLTMKLSEYRHVDQVHLEDMLRLGLAGGRRQPIARRFAGSTCGKFATRWSGSPSHRRLAIGVRPWSGDQQLSLANNDRKTIAEEDLGPGLDGATKAKIRTFFPRYPTKRAVLLPAGTAHHGALGYVSLKAMRDIAELLELAQSAVMDVVTFYTHFWTHPKGRKTIVLCRSLTCELMGGRAVLDAIEQKLGIQETKRPPTANIP